MKIDWTKFDEFVMKNHKKIPYLIVVLIVIFFVAKWIYENFYLYR